MKAKIISTLIAIIIVVALAQALKADAASTTIAVQPEYSEVDPLQTFKINITIANVVDLAAWDFQLYYPSRMVNATKIVEGPFLKKVAQTSFLIVDFTDTYNSTHGRIWAACTMIGQGAGANGNGTLAEITFAARSPGLALLHLEETNLLDSKMPPNKIPHSTLDGAALIKGHDIAITGLITSKTGCQPMPTVGKGYTTNINVTIANLGTCIENFNVSVYANTTPIETVTVTDFCPETQTTITILWNTTGFNYGNYTVSAYATPVEDETYIENNWLTDSWIIITIPGDTNGDYKTNLADLVILAKAYGSRNEEPTSPNWNPNADFNDDGTVSLADLVILAKHYGQTIP